MKKFIFLILIFQIIFLYPSFEQTKIEQATVALVDVLEHVHQNYIPCPEGNIHEVNNHVDDLFDRAMQASGKSMRMYTFISINFFFDNQHKKDLSYMFYALLYAEVDPAVLATMTPDDIKKLKKTVSSKLVGLYEDRKIGIDQIASGCYVACVESGVEQIQKNKD